MYPAKAMAANRIKPLMNFIMILWAVVSVINRAPKPANAIIGTTPIRMKFINAIVGTHRAPSTGRGRS